ncbi:anti-sigma factor [Flexivirga sp. B27]
MSDEHIEPIDYAMDALDDVSRRRADQHLSGCEQCRAEVAEWQEATAGLGSSVDPVDPPPELRAKVLAEAARSPQEHAQASATTHRGPSAARRTRHPGRWLAAAAAAIVVIGGGITVASKPWQSEPTPVSAVAKVTDAPDAQHASKPVNGGSLEMIFSTAQEKAVATLRGVDPASDGKVYQAWLITPKGMVNAGLLQPGKPTVLNGSINHAKGAAVTVEPAGGSKQPTTKPIVQIFMS